MKIRRYSASPSSRLNLLRCSQSIPVRPTWHCSRVDALRAYVMSHPLASRGMFTSSFLPSGPSYSVQSRTALTEQSRRVMVPGTSGNGCLHLWVQQQTQSPSLPHWAGSHRWGLWEKRFGSLPLGENSVCHREADANTELNGVDNPHESRI